MKDWINWVCIFTFHFIQPKSIGEWLSYSLSQLQSETNPAYPRIHSVTYWKLSQGLRGNHTHTCTWQKAHHLQTLVPMPALWNHVLKWVSSTQGLNKIHTWQSLVTGLPTTDPTADPAAAIWPSSNPTRLWFQR